MEFETMKNMLDETLNSLIGKKILTVYYAATDYFDEKYYWDHGKLHEVERGNYTDEKNVKIEIYK